MITRIVRMEFHPEKVPAFLQTFRDAEMRIRKFSGCCSLQLVADAQNKNVYYTVSVWKDMEHLENYRASDLFAATWKAAKEGFAAAPQAFSLEGNITAGML